MPLFEFTGPGSMTYPETRDALDHPLGTVEPGERREFEKAPDQWWVPAGDGGGSGGGSPDGGEGVSGGSGGEDASGVPEPEPAPTGPVPAPPAVVPGA